MAWTDVADNGRVVYSETITLPNATSTYSATIDFVAPETPFTVIANTAALNSVGSVVFEVQGSYDGANWITETSGFIGNVDTATLTAVYDPKATGDYPYFRLEITAAADDSANQMTYKVITTPWTPV